MRNEPVMTYYKAVSHHFQGQTEYKMGRQQTHKQIIMYMASSPRMAPGLPEYEAQCKTTSVHFQAYSDFTGMIMMHTEK